LKVISRTENSVNAPSGGYFTEIISAACFEKIKVRAEFFTR
jgi:hypothetical protein